MAKKVTRQLSVLSNSYVRAVFPPICFPFLHPNIIIKNVYTFRCVCLHMHIDTKNYCYSLIPVDFATLWEENLTDKQKICVKFACISFVHHWTHKHRKLYTHILDEEWERKKKPYIQQTICLCIYLYEWVCVCACVSVWLHLCLYASKWIHIQHSQNTVGIKLHNRSADFIENKIFLET